MTRHGLLERLERSAARAQESPDTVACTPERFALKAVQKRLLDTHAELLGSSSLGDTGRQQLRAAIQGVIATESLAAGKTAREALAEYILNEVTGLGPLEALVQDPSVTEIMVNGFDNVFVEKDGRIEHTDIVFRDNEQVLEVIVRAMAPLGRRLDRITPFVDGRLPDGSRLHACIPPISLNGPVLTIRKFPRQAWSLDRLVELNTLPPDAAVFLTECVTNRLNLLVAGGTGSGKTVTLNALLGLLRGRGERIVTIEDCSELYPEVENLVSMEVRPATIEGTGEVTIRTLVRNALRMRPDRLVIGEVRGAEAFDMLQAMNTGHQGSMSTVHANGPEDVLRRVEGMALMAPEVPERVVRELVVASIDAVIFQRRLPTGQRRVTDIVLMRKQPGESRTMPVYSTKRSGTELILHRTAEPLPDWLPERTKWGGASH